MQKLFGQIISQFKDFYQGLTPIKRTSLIVASAMVMVSVSIVLLMLSGTNHVPLFKNVPPDQLALVLEKLQKNNIPFKLDDGGKTVLIPSDLLHSTQMAVMTEIGSSQVGQVGLELFEKQDFGMTTYAQRINYQRALQGELIRAINTLSAVKQSKVILAIPPKKTFLEESGQPSASVILDLYPGKHLSPEQVRGITNLIASAVEEMDADKVTILDSRGKLISRQSSGEMGASSDLLDLKRKVEQGLEERVEGILSKVVGSGRIVARVDASLNMKQTSTVEEKVDPDMTAVSSSATEEELLDGSRTNPTGIPGSRANLPGAGDTGEVGFKQNVRKEMKTTNFSVPKTVRNVKEAAGNIEKLSIAVLVDGNLVKEQNEKGEETQKYVPRTAEELAKYETIVKNTIGFNAARGDSVRIENIQFQIEDFTETERQLTELQNKKLLHSLFKWSLLSSCLILFFFIVVRPFMRWITDSFQETVEDMLPRTIEELEELQSVDHSLPGMGGALPVLEDSIDPNKAESELLKERIMAYLEADQEKAAGAFALWLSRRET
ncbi:MAG: flagellar M-ring protein FliF [Bdellovibrionales bacterium]|nr:flagellar M-ring protein FliF [Bdellovibrionales bacterium]